MQCPKCGTENPDEAQSCHSCNWLLTGASTHMPTAVAKTSGLAVTSFVLAILSIFTLSLTMIPAVIFGIVGLVIICNSRGKLKGNGFAVAGIAISIAPIILFGVSLIIFTFIWGLDAPPIPDDYTIADLRSAPPECNRSYELLMSLSDERECPPDAPAIGLSAQDVNTIWQINEVIKEGEYSIITEVLEANADNIKQAWKNGQKGRDIISELNTFPEIADLTEPDLDFLIKFLRNFRHLTCLYKSYAYLQTEQGKSYIAVNELIELDSVYRKLSVNVRSTITKLGCIAGLSNSIMTANFIANNPKASQESLDILAEHFTPLTDEQISLRNPVLFQYLLMRDVFLEEMSKDLAAETPMLKKNSFLRLYKNLTDYVIYTLDSSGQSEFEELSVWPRFLQICPNVSLDPDSNFRLPWFYKCYNPLGSLLIHVFGAKIPSGTIFFQIKDDLLQIVLNKRLGTEINLKARAYSEEYIIDTEKKIIFSPGPDGEPNTKDDIKLTINLEVLNLTD
jgi:hypothetical protein